MSDGSAEAPLWMPDLGDMPAGPARVLIWLIVWRDGRGSCDPTHADLCKVTKLDESTVRRHTGWLEREGWARRERRRRADNSLGGWRYWLDLQRLGLAPSEGAKSTGRSEGGEENLNDDPSEGAICALPREGAPPVGNHVENPGEAPVHFAPSPPESEGAKYAGRQNSEGAKYAGLIEPGARAGAAFPLPSYSYFLSFPWRDDAMKAKAETVLAACGEGLGGLGLQQGRVLKSLAYVLEPGGAWDGFDLDLDIVPVVRRKTGPGRKSPLWDFALLTENLEAHRAKRLRSVGEPKVRKAAKAFAPAPDADPAAARAKRMEALRREIAAIDRGEGQPFMLPNRERSLSGEWLADAYARVRAADAAELSRLEADEPMAKAEG